MEDLSDNCVSLVSSLTDLLSFHKYSIRITVRDMVSFNLQGI